MLHRKMLLLLSLMLSLSYITHVYFVEAPLPSDSKNFAMNFLQNVAQINLTKYEIRSFESNDIIMPNSRHYGTLIHVVFGNDNCNFSAIFNLIEGKFWTYDLSLRSGESENVVQTFNSSITIARNSIESYKQVFNVSHCQNFGSMLSEAIATQRNVLDTNSIHLEISQNDTFPMHSTTLQWLQKINDEFTIDQYSVGLTLSKAGFVTHLIDNLNVNYLASTIINISKEKAINISMPYIEAYALKHGQKIKSVDCKLSFARDTESLRGDDLAIYPIWSVIAWFEGLNEESVYGYNVATWADNGEVVHQDPIGSYAGSMPDSSLLNDSFILFVFGIISIPIILIFLGIYYKHRRRKHGD